MNSRSGGAGSAAGANVPRLWRPTAVQFLMKTQLPRILMRVPKFVKGLARWAKSSFIGAEEVGPWLKPMQTGKTTGSARGLGGG